MPDKPLMIKRPEILNSDWIVQQIRTGIDLQSAPASELSRGEQWKVWLDSGQKTHFDLIKELANAPGRPKLGDPISDIPVPFYEPGPVQTAAHQATAKIVLVAGGVRAGKSKWLAANLLPWLFKSYSHVWILAPEYWFAHDEFNYIQMWLDWLGVPLNKLSKPQDGRYSLTTKWGAVLDTMTGKEAEKIEMANLNAAGMAEAGHIDEIILGRVLQRVFQKGGPVYISGTLDEAQPWYTNSLKRYKNGDEHGDWHSFSIPSWDNKAAFPMGDKDQKVEEMRRNLSEDEFARRIEAIPMAPEGLVFKEFNADIHVVPMRTEEVTPQKLKELMTKAYSPFQDGPLTAPTPIFEQPLGFEVERWNSTEYPPFQGEAPKPIIANNGFKVMRWDIPDMVDVELAIDPGYDPGRYAVLACVIQRDTILVIDEIYEAKQDGETIIQMCKDKPWWPRVKRGVIDTASKQHHEGMSEHEKWRKYAGLRLLTQYVPIPDGIARYRNFLMSPSNGRPRLYIAPHCNNLIWEHSNYRYPRVKNQEERSVRELPIDNHNHAIKALTYFMVVKFNFTDSSGMKTTSRRYIQKREKQVGPASYRWYDDTGYSGSRGW